jgi:hypothetical protein
MKTKPRRSRLPVRSRSKPPARCCPTCRSQQYRWPGTDEYVCLCTKIAPIRLDLPFSLPIRPPTARWPGTPQPQPAA